MVKEYWPEKAVYIILQNAERYAFVANGHQINMVYNEANGNNVLNPANASDPACTPKSK